MADKDKKRDPMPPPDATPEEIGEFWDTHSLADYWDETHEVEFQVNLKSRQDPSPDESEMVDQSDPLSTEQGWQKLKNLIQSIKPADFEKLIATLLTSFLNIPFVVARSGAQPSGDARNLSGDVSMQAKRYTGKRDPNTKTIEGDIRDIIRELPYLAVYVLVVSRDAAQLHDKFDTVSEETGLDIVILELSNDLSDLGALCINFWKDIREFFDFSESGQNQEFLAWVEKTTDDPEMEVTIKELRSKLEYGLQTQNHVQNNTKEYLRKRFTTDKGFNPINLSQAIERKFVESEITDWWETSGVPVCYLEGEEGIGKSWLAAKTVSTICEEKNIVALWLDSKNWENCEDLSDMLETGLNLLYPPSERRKIPKLQEKIISVWSRPTLIVLDGLNEGEAIEAAKRILDEYFTHKDKLENRIRFLLTTRPLEAYWNLWEECHRIPVESFNDSELQEALTRKGLQLSDLPNSLKDTASIPRYLQRCLELRELFESFDNVTKEMVLWADLLHKIKHTDPQVQKKFDWQNVEEAQEDLAKLAREAKWTNVDDAPQASLQLLIDCFPNYREIRRDLEEQRIALKAHKRQAELSEDHVVLGWAVHLSNLFDSMEFSNIESLFERFRQELEPIPSEDLRSEALFVALQITAIPPYPNISLEHHSRKRAALMLAWLNSHNIRKVSERLSFWVGKDSDAYAQLVEFEFDRHNAPKYEEMLIEPLAKAWLDEKGQVDRLVSRLKKWLLPTHSVNSPENREYMDFEGHRIPVKNYDPQVQLSAAALSILSQRPEPEFLETLARCYEILERYESPDQNIGILMRWGYTEKFLDDLYWLAEQSPLDTQLLKGVCRLVDFFRMGLPPNLERALSKEDLEKRIFREQYDPILNRFINHIRNEERILTGDSPETNANRGYFDLGCLAVRKDLSPWCDEDQNEIKRISRYVSVSPEKGINKDLMPWIAKYDPEGYRELSCNLKINALNPEYPLYALRVTQELIFERKDCKRITEAVLEMKECLLQGNDSSCEYADLLTEILLFSASEDRLTDWFEFLALHELLRDSICYEPLPYLLKQLLPKSIVELAQQRLEKLRSSVSDNQTLSNGETQEFSEEEFWWTLYAYGTPVDENSVKFALNELKLRKPDSTGTYPILRLALSNSKQFLDEMLIDERIQEHLLSKNGRRFIVPPYDQGKDVIAYDKLMSLLPQEIVGPFLCSPDRHDDLMRWGRDLMARMCSILQGTEGDSNSVAGKRIEVNSDALRTWAEHDTTNFRQLANEYLTQLSKFPQYSQALSYFTDTIRCLLLRFEPDKAKQYYYQWNAESFKIVYRTRYGVPTLLAQLWKVEFCNSPAHRQFRRELLEECLNDEEIMFMTLAALAEGGRDELWSLVTQEYIKNPYAKERNLGVSILPWFGTDEAIEKLNQLKSEDLSRWVCEHATWAYEVAQQEKSCREVYREVLQTRDLFKISAVFEQIKPALSPTARWWCEIEHKKFREESQDIDPKLAALVDRFWSLWGNSEEMKRNIEVFRRKLREYCRGEKLSAGSTPRIAPWWKPTSDS